MKHLFRIFVITLTCLPSILFGSHLMGGEITWKCDGNGAFIFQAKLYRDCNGVNGPSSLTLMTNAPVGSISCSLISQIDISPVGIGCPTCSIPLGFATAREEFIYESLPIHLNGTPPPSGWYFAYTDCCRNAAITNLAGGTGWFTLRSIMYPYSGQNTNPCFDSSPVFAESPTLGLCIGDTTYFNHAAFDTDLDSLVYSWDQPLDGTNFPATIPYPYDTGYSFQSPLPGPIQNSLNSIVVLDSLHGSLTFVCHTTGSFVTVTKVSSFKCGQLVSEIFREVQIGLFNCPINAINLNIAPKFYPPEPVQSFNIVAGDTFSYSFICYDFDSLPISSGGGAQTVTMYTKSLEFGTGDTSYTSGCAVPPCAVLKHPSPFIGPLQFTQTMTWPTACSHAGFYNGCLQFQRTFQFLFRADDDFCPAHGIRYKSLLVNVNGPEIYLAGNDLAVSYPGVTIQWYLNGIPIPGATDTLYTPTQNGIYTIVATTSSGCSMLSNPVNRVLSGQAEMVSDESSFTVFPNPGTANSVIHVSLRNVPAGSNLIRIYDVSGRLAKQFPIVITNENEHLMLQLDDMQNGVYNISIDGKAGVLERKLILN